MEVGEDVCFPGCFREALYWDFCCMGRGHILLVGHLDWDGDCSRFDIGKWCVSCEVMLGAAGVNEYGRGGA